MRRLGGGESAGSIGSVPVQPATFRLNRFIAGASPSLAQHAAATAAEELRLAKLAQLRELANVEWAEHAERGFGGHAGVRGAAAGAWGGTRPAP